MRAGETFALIVMPCPVTGQVFFTLIRRPASGVAAPKRSPGRFGLRAGWHGGLFVSCCFQDGLKCEEGGRGEIITCPGPLVSPSGFGIPLGKLYSRDKLDLGFHFFQVGSLLASSLIRSGVGSDTIPFSLSLFFTKSAVMSVHELDMTRSYTADAQGTTANTLQPTISKLPSLSHPPHYEVFWKPEDPENPRLWPLWYKAVSVVTMSLGATVISLFSTLYTSGIPGLEEEFHISKMVGLLGVFTYLLGMAIGTIIFAPLSEIVGRRPVYLVSMTIFLILILPSALAHNIEAILISRFFGGLFGSAIMGNSPASVNDIVSDQHRAFAFGIWSIGPTNGPVYGPIIGGFVFEYLGWRWTNWLVLIVGGAVLALMYFIPETYAPVILRKRAASIRKETSDPKWWTQYDSAEDLSKQLKIGLSRPFVMLFTEPIWSVNLLSLGLASVLRSATMNPRRNSPD